MDNNSVSIIIRKAQDKDTEFILEANRINVQYLSPMDIDRYHKLSTIADIVLVAEVNSKPAAFLIAFREDADEYDSENYRWFNSHYDRFLYIDRIVVDDSFRHLGIGRRLYGEVLEHAKKSDIEFVTAEIDLIPYNGTSIEFHRIMGFREVGTQEVHNGTVKVSLQEACIQ